MQSKNSFLKMNNFYVYVFLDPRKPSQFNYNGYELTYEPFYVGKGKNKRCYNHLREWSLKHKTLKNNKIKSLLKLGLTPIIVKLFLNLSEVEAFSKEKEIIKFIGRFDLGLGPLLNMTDGGEGNSGIILTDETKEKISKKLKSLRLERSEETKLKISNANKNRVYSDEYIKQMKEIRKGPKLTHRKKYFLINPNQITFEFLGKEELVKFILENELSERKLLTSINKGVITINDVRVTTNTQNTKTKNCIGWELKKIKT
jgi:uncharacterized protein YxeA